MVSQKVPRINGLHIYSNSYLITFKVEPLRIYLVAPWILPLLEEPAEDLFVIFRSFIRRVLFDVLHCWETFSLADHFQGNEQPKATQGERSREYRGWTTTGIFLPTRNCYTTSDVWLGASLWRRTSSAVPANGRTASSELHNGPSAKLACRNGQ
jgi:hypothetical protein